MSLARLFPDADYGFHLTLSRGEPVEFFAPGNSHKEILSERQRWLSASPETYAACREEAIPLVNEAAEMMRKWHSVDEPINGADGLEKTIALGQAVEPDWVLLASSTDAGFRVVAGCVCFPSSWALEEKMGQPLDFVHAAVPGLNATLGRPVANLLGKMRPGVAWLRANWGLSASPERNQHPTRRLPALALPLALDHVWLRIEDQLLTILPATGALLFGIRIVNHRLDQFIEQEPQAAAGFLRALATMPEEVARYKNLAPVRPALLELVEGLIPR